MSAVGQRIKQERIKRGISQYKLAKLSGVTQPTISAIEAEGQTRSPAVDTVEKLAAALQCDVSVLMGEDTKKQEADIDPLLQQIMTLARQLTPDRRRQLLDFARFQAGQQ